MRAQIAHSFVLISLLLAAACAPAAATQAPGTAAPQPPALSPNTLATATGQIVEPASSPVPTTIAADTATPTQGSFIIQLTPVPTETPLPTLELPTEAAHPPALQVWDGLPTYLAESKPGFYFRLRFDPGIWALTTDQYGFPALGHRQIAGCLITPSAGRGLALNGSVDHEVRRLGNISYQVSTVFVNGVKEFVTYTGGDGNIYTGFQVSFQGQSDQCLADSETVLAQLKSVVDFQATPIATP
jgi:hypothetical protein